VRADLWDAFMTEGQVSPRINFVYKLLPETTLHAGYGRYFSPPPLELIQSGDVVKFNGTTNSVPPSLIPNASVPVKSERYHYFDVGVNQDITSHFHVGLDGYLKLKKYTLDEGQFGPALIFSPDNSARGYVAGVEATVSYEKDGVALWGNAARSQAMAQGLTTGQWQFDQTQVAYMQSHWYHLDHDQNWTASAGGSYKWAQYRTKVYADVLYGSGLYSGFCNETELPSYATLNMGMTQIVSINPGNDFKLRFDITNVTDVKYEIRQGTEDNNPNGGIGVFAPQYLPRRAFYVGISKDF
jgi:outer membrane receptor protein involved in Fe transport